MIPKARTQQCGHGGTSSWRLWVGPLPNRGPHGTRTPACSPHARTGPTCQLASDAATDLRLPSTTLTVANNTCSAALLPSPSPPRLATAPIHSPTAAPPPPPAARDEPLPRRDARVAAEPRAARVPPRRRGRVRRLPQHGPRDAERGVAGAPDRAPGRRLRPPPLRRLRPLPRALGVLGEGRTPRPRSRPERLQRAAAAQRQVEGRLRAGWQRRRPPVLQLGGGRRTLPPRQRQVPPLEQRRHRRCPWRREHDDALDGRADPPETSAACPSKTIYGSGSPHWPVTAAHWACGGPAANDPVHAGRR